MPTDTWLWKAWYSDDTYLDEYDETGQSRSFASIDQSRCVAIELCSQQIGVQDIVLAIPVDARPIFFRRRSHVGSVDADGFHETTRLTSTVVGFQKTINGRNVKALTVFMHDGSVFITDDSESF